MLDGSPIIPSGDPGDDADAALWTALAAADDDMLAAITDRLDLDTGLARVFKDLESLLLPRACVPEEAFHLRVATVIRDVNRSNAELGDLYLRICLAADAARGKRLAATDATRAARTAEDAFRRARTRPATWRARRHARQAGQAARIAWAEASRAAAARDRLIEAYIGGFRKDSLLAEPAGQQDVIESALRQHLLDALSVRQE
jgi:hypothetical protein